MRLKFLRQLKVGGHKGVTLIETLVALGLSGIVITAVMFNINLSNKHTASSKQLFEVIHWTNQTAYILQSESSCTASFDGVDPSQGSTLDHLKITAGKESKVKVGQKLGNSEITKIYFFRNPRNIMLSDWLAYLAIDFKSGNQQFTRQFTFLVKREWVGGNVPGNITECLGPLGGNVVYRHICDALGGNYGDANLAGLDPPPYEVCEPDTTFTPPNLCNCPIACQNPPGACSYPYPNNFSPGYTDCVAAGCPSPTTCCPTANVCNSSCNDPPPGPVVVEGECTWIDPPPPPPPEEKVCYLGESGEYLRVHFDKIVSILDEPEADISEIKIKVCELLGDMNTRDPGSAPMEICDLLDYGSNHSKTECNNFVNGSAVDIVPGAPQKYICRFERYNTTIDEATCNTSAGKWVDRDPSLVDDWVCEFDVQSCPATWVRHENWSRTSAKTCSSDCSSTETATTTTKFHNWANKPIEKSILNACEFKANYAKCGEEEGTYNHAKACGYKSDKYGETCVATVESIGCK